MDEAQQFRIDSHKVHLHPQRVADWLAGKDIAPIYMEISPSGACNHRCRFCGLDFMGYKPRFLPLDIMRQRFTEMASAGLKSVMFAGEGEPFLHRQMPEMAEAAKAAGMDVAFTTNAALFSPDKARRVLPVTSWIKVSCNAGTPETYAHVHGTKAGDFDRVMEHMTEAVRLRRELGSSCTLGFQMVLLPENMQEATILAQRVQDLGADYLVIKPYSVHRQSHKSEYNALRYDANFLLAQTLQKFTTEHFSVIFRHEAMSRAVVEKAAYTRCLALPFWGYLDSGGSLWACLRHIGEEAFALGSIFDTMGESVFSGPLRQKNLAYCSAQVDVTDCHKDCRMDVVNRYLYELKNPGKHSSFI